MTVHYLCSDSNSPTGGIKVIYRHVDILNRHGVSAYVLHQKRGFRCTWFDNDTRIAYTDAPFKSLLSRARNRIKDKLDPGRVQTIPLRRVAETEISPGDFLVLPEKYGPELAAIGRGIPRVILNQNGFLTFRRFGFDAKFNANPYSDATVRGVLVNSEHVEEYLQYTFPGLHTQRFSLSIDPGLFRLHAPKKKQISFSQIKNATDALQVVSILKCRGALEGWEVVPFTNLPQHQVAAIMRDSLVFLSLGNREGFGLPPAEAMACGCVVVGYHGWGGREFFKPEFSFPIEDGDIIGFARKVEEVMRQYDRDPQPLIDMGRRAADFITLTYSPEAEERQLVAAWRAILDAPTLRAA